MRLDDARLAQICDGLAVAADYETRIMASELLAYRAGERQRIEQAPRFVCDCGEVFHSSAAVLACASTGHPNAI